MIRLSVPDTPIDTSAPVLGLCSDCKGNVWGTVHGTVCLKGHGGADILTTKDGALFPCIACTATGTSSKGTQCHACKGTGSGGWISPSQLKQFIACELQWWFNYIAGAPRALSTPAQLSGIRVHGQLENLFKGYPLTDPIAIRIASHIAPCGTAAKPEVSAHVLIDGIGFFCIADLVCETVIYDYKTSSDPRKYGLTADGLVLDEQAIILAHAFPASEVLVWIYASTRTSVSFTIPAPADLARANKAQVTVPADRLIQVRTGKRMPSGNLENCFSYGQPCPHIPYCPAKENVPNPFDPESNHMSTIDPARLEAARARLHANGTLPQSTPAAATAPAMSPLEKARAALAQSKAAPAAPQQSALEKAKAMMAAAQAEADALAAAEAEAVSDEDAALMAALEAEEAAAQAAVEAAAAPQQSALEKARALMAAQAKAIVPTGATTGAIAAQAKAMTAQKRHMGATGETLRPDPEAVIAKTIGTLYIDCMPDSGIDGEACVDAHDVIESAHARVRKAHGVPHYAAMDYGQGKPALEMAIAEVLRERGADSMVANRVDVGLPAFIRASTSIVRALA